MKHKPIEEQVVVICGASSGLGRRTALEFARHGARVIVASRNQEALDELVEEIRAFGGEATAISADVSDYAQVRTIARRTIRLHGRIDTWAHFAGTNVYAPFRETTPEEFARVVDVNLLGAVYAAMVALPHLTRQGGALIEVSSLEAQLGTPYQSAYTASKHGMQGFMDVLRMELRHDGVPVSITNIIPSPVDLPLLDHARARLGFAPTPLAPTHNPDAVVDAVLHAAEYPSDEVIIGSSGWLFLLAKRLFPRFTDLLITWLTNRRRHRKPKGLRRAMSTGEAIFHPAPGSPDADSHKGIHASMQRLHPGLRRTLGSALLAGAATALLWRGTRKA